MVYKYETMAQHIRKLILPYYEYYLNNQSDPEVILDLMNRLRKDKNYDAMMGIMAIDFFLDEYEYLGMKEECRENSEIDLLVNRISDDMDLEEFELFIENDPSLLSSLLFSSSIKTELTLSDRYEIVLDAISSGYETVFTRFHLYYESEVLIKKLNDPKTKEEVMEERFYDEYLKIQNLTTNNYLTCQKLATSLIEEKFALQDNEFWYSLIKKYYRYAKAVSNIMPKIISAQNNEILEVIEKAKNYNEIKKYLSERPKELTEVINQYVKSLSNSFNPIQKHIDEYCEKNNILKVLEK